MAIKDNYDELFAIMQIRPEWQAQIRSQADKIISKQANYQLACDKVNKAMPWYFVGIIHFMECSLRFDRHLHNGDTLKLRTTHVPAGRPVAAPMNGFPAGYTWIESAVDALKLKGFDRVNNWEIADILQRLESYNGLGYQLYHKMHSPYLWSGTNHYTKGKYEADGKFNPELVSKQIGAAALLKLILE